MRIVFLGDSHLARVRRDLPLVGSDVCNAANGGTSSLGLLSQAAEAAVRESDLVVLSVGTNDAAPWKRVPVSVFAETVRHCMESVPARRWIYLTPPGVDEARLSASGDRTNAILDEYRKAALAVSRAAGAGVVRTERVIEPLGPAAFVKDGLHLSGPAYRLVLDAIADAVQTTT
jgi:lysophospholipase L1-like esterase